MKPVFKHQVDLAESVLFSQSIQKFIGALTTTAFTVTLILIIIKLYISVNSFPTAAVTLSPQSSIVTVHTLQMLHWLKIHLEPSKMNQGKQKQLDVSPCQIRMA